MNGFVRSLALLSVGFGLLVAQSAFTAWHALHPFTPNLLLPIVIFLGVAPEVSLVRGALLSFALGYLLDLFCGNLMSLQTFICVATFMLSRGAGLRLFLRGPGFQVALTFLVGVLAGGATLALRAIFERPSPFPVRGGWDTAISLLAPALATALPAPLVFVVTSRVDAWVGRRRDDSGTAA